MKKFTVSRMLSLTLTALVGISLSGCGTTAGLNMFGQKPPTQLQQYAMACTSYDMALQGVTMLGAMGVIQKPVIDQTILASHQFTPICEQTTPPANLAAVTQQLTNAVTSGVLQEGLQYMKTHPLPVAAPAPVAVKPAAVPSSPAAKP